MLPSTSGRQLLELWPAGWWPTRWSGSPGLAVVFAAIGIAPGDSPILVAAFGPAVSEGRRAGDDPGDRLNHLGQRPLEGTGEAVTFGE
jgi:hypothetical protein